MILHHHTSRKPGKQNGIALFVVIVMLLLSLLIVLSSSKTSLFNEAFTGNESDYSRALEAAQLLVADATVDITGKKADGTNCSAAPCRSAVTTVVHFPEEGSGYDEMKANLIAVSPIHCKNGICMPICPDTTVAGVCNGNEPRFWLTSGALSSMASSGATYGQYTGATPGSTGNTILMSGKAWYWVEVMSYMKNMVNPASTRLPNNPKFPYVFRITAVAQGAKEGTQAVVQSIVSINKPN